MAAAVLLHLLLLLAVDLIDHNSPVRPALAGIVVAQLVTAPKTPARTAASHRDEEEAATSKSHRSAAITHTPPQVQQTDSVLPTSAPERPIGNGAASDRPTAAADVTATAALPANEGANPSESDTRIHSSGKPSLDARSQWEASVLAHLDHFKQYPSWARFYGQEDVISVRIEVSRSGKVMAQQITASRGYRLLDDEVVALLQRASPLPAPPTEISNEYLTFVVSIDFHIDQPSTSLPGHGL